MKKSIPLAAVLLLSALAAFADEPAATPAAPASAAAAVAAASPAPRRMVCHKETPLGSQMLKTVCHPAELTTEEAQENANLQRDIQRQAAIADQNRHH